MNNLNLFFACLVWSGTLMAIAAPKPMPLGLAIAAMLLSTFPVINAIICIGYLLLLLEKPRVKKF